jgi:hypothetical protein
MLKADKKPLSCVGMADRAAGRETRPKAMRPNSIRVADRCAQEKVTGAGMIAVGFYTLAMAVI